VLRKLSLLAVFAGVLTPWAPSRAQDEPSVADAARQARQNKDQNKEKNAIQPKKVLTEDDMASSKTGGDAGSLGLSAIAAPKSAGTGDDSPTAKAWAGINRAEGALDRLAPLDRAALAKVVLAVNDVDFPNRRAWEEKLFVAKERYVARSRQLLNGMKQLMENAQSLQDSQGAADSPQAQQLAGRAQQLLSDATNTEAAFKAVMQEGQDLAKQAKSN